MTWHGTLVLSYELSSMSMPPWKLEWLNVTPCHTWIQPYGKPNINEIWLETNSKDLESITGKKAAAQEIMSKLENNRCKNVSKTAVRKVFGPQQVRSFQTNGSETDIISFSAKITMWKPTPVMFPNFLMIIYHGLQLILGLTTALLLPVMPSTNTVPTQVSWKSDKYTMITKILSVLSW